MLIGLMVLLFLRDWRSVIVVVLNIPLGADGGRGRALAHRADDQPDDPGRAGAGHRHPGGRGDGRDREHPHADEPRPLDRPGRAAGQRANGRPAAAGDALHPGGVHPVVLHARGAAGDVRAAVAGGRVRDGGLLPPVEHVRAGALGLAVASRPSRRFTDHRALRRPCRSSRHLALRLASSILLRSVPPRL